MALDAMGYAPSISLRVFEHSPLKDNRQTVCFEPLESIDDAAGHLIGCLINKSTGILIGVRFIVCPPDGNVGKFPYFYVPVKRIVVNSLVKPFLQLCNRGNVGSSVEKSLSQSTGLSAVGSQGNPSQ